MMICRVCKTNPVTMIGSTVCSLKCSCDLNWDSYELVRARLTNAIAESKMPQNSAGKARS